MVAITATDTQHESKEDPNPPSETVVAHKNALADLGDGPNSTPLPTDYDLSKQDHDAEVQREWDQVASDTWANSSGNMAAMNLQSSEPENSNEGASQPKQERKRQSSSHGLGIQVQALNEEEDEIGNSSTAYSSGRTSSPKDGTQDKEKILKLSPTQIQELISSPDSVPVQKIPDGADRIEGIIATVKHATSSDDISAKAKNRDEFLRSIGGSLYPNQKSKDRNHLDAPPSFVISSEDPPMSAPISQRPHPTRMVTSPTTFPRTDSLSDDQKFTPNSIGRQKLKATPGHLDLSEHKGFAEDSVPSPMPQSIPLPPLSIPAYLELELSSSRPSPLYIHRSVTSQIPYESSAVKLERLLNFILLPPALEQVLWFGAIACLDAWLHSFTILPLRFIKALYILVSSWVYNVYREAQFIATFIINGVGRVWRRHVKRTKDTRFESAQDDRHNATASHNTSVDSGSHPKLRTRDNNSRLPKISTNAKHRRQKSTPSALQADDKADILKGFLIICTCVVLSFFDASRMYHWIRGQNAIKLYVIYNVLEVGDRLLSAIGQDVLECLFSQEALARGEDGRSKVVRPFWLFLLALAYTTLHAMALFYQVITLNVAVNSYSNALITLLLSNQFVEIKSAVFKKFEKENLFQMTCADVVERFQLWLMLTIIASRNIVETGAFTSWFTVGAGVGNYFSSAATNSTPLSASPRSATSILPQSFTFLPSTFFSSLTGGANSLLPQLAQVLGPFLIVLGSEMMVDWLKHAYIAKFNNIRPAIYGRFLDVLAKDYYTNAFVDQNLTKRLGLAVIPMACLFFRVSVQTYQMFLQALLPMQASATEHSASLTAIHEHYSNLPQPSSPPVPFTIKTAMSSSLGRLSWAFNTIMENAIPSPVQSVTFFTIVLVLTGYLILLILKLTLGILLLSFSRSRYKVMKEREQKLFFGARNERNSFTSPSTSQTHTQSHKGSQSHHVADANGNYTVDGGRRVGGWGVVEVGDDKRRWIYADDPNGLRKLKSKERGDNDKNANKSNGALLNLDGVRRYEMVAKRIW